jgi:hypothetical protein
MGLALLAHAHVPIKFWDDAFLIATYLINRMPTHVIDNASPLERLLHTPPNYSMLRVFGCACWPHLRAYNKTKLSFRSKECVFLGYSSLHKGYKCLDHESGRVYVSRDVIFDEHVFPFHRDSNQSSSYMASNRPLEHGLLVSIPKLVQLGFRPLKQTSHFFSSTRMAFRFISSFMLMISSSLVLLPLPLIGYLDNYEMILRSRT